MKSKAMDDNRKVSVTFQIMLSVFKAIGRIAESMGYTRSKNGSVQPEMTPVIVLALEYVATHEEAFRQWVANGKKD